MDKASLARKQKRHLDWNRAIKEDGIEDAVKQEFVAHLKLYRNLLARLWESDKASAEEISQLEDLERQLEALHTASRFHA